MFHTLAPFLPSPCPALCQAMATLAEMLDRLYKLAGQAAIWGCLWLVVSQLLEYYARKKRLAKVKDEAAGAAQPAASAGSSKATGAAAGGAAATDALPEFDEVGGRAQAHRGQRAAPACCIAHTHTCVVCAARSPLRGSNTQAAQVGEHCCPFGHWAPCRPTHSGRRS